MTLLSLDNGCTILYRKMREHGCCKDCISHAEDIIETASASKNAELLSKFVNYVIDNDLSNTLEAAMYRFIEEQE